MSERLPSYGGQALIEGVLMRGSKALAAAFRAPDGKIIVETQHLEGIYRSPVARIPFLRGLVLLWDALGLGFRYLTLSANVQAGEEEQIEGPMQYVTIGFSLLFAVALFFVAPAGIGHLGERLTGMNPWWSNVVEGLVRLALMIGYIWLIGRMPDIQRVFAYHGAEHKTINAYEAGADLKPEVVIRYSLQHPRCGTSFLLTLIVLSILVFALIGPLPPFWRYASRIILLPLLAGVAYEYIRWMANHLDSPLVRLLIRPNLALQSLTTREPTLEMLEVAITAFTTMLELEEGRARNRFTINVKQQSQEVAPF
ncbi:MAG TPA: DUF1385 domain-containing protein [Anaerolineaceae bacterium]